MREIKQVENTLMYREIPLEEWLVLGGFGLVMGLFSLQALSLDLSSLVMFLISLMSLGLAARRPDTEIAIDPDKRIITIRQRYLISTNFRIIAFSDLARPFEVRRKKILGVSTTRLVLKLTSGETISVAHPPATSTARENLGLYEVAGIFNDAMGPLGDVRALA